MLGYSLMVAMKRVFGFRTFVASVHLRDLDVYFENATAVTSLDRLCDEGRSYEWVEHLTAPKFVPVGKAVNFCEGV